jgi:hypothetical protein
MDGRSAPAIFPRTRLSIVKMHPSHCDDMGLPAVDPSHGPRSSERGSPRETQAWQEPPDQHRCWICVM